MSSPLKLDKSLGGGGGGSISENGSDAVPRSEPTVPLQVVAIPGGMIPGVVEPLSCPENE